ncbi:GTP-binding protein [Oceanobacillus rekensis]|uniref:GTP-binding protein n=1 Tax=Oceanobacillus rekensis TaxID=937927 RepID=UPI000B42F878|nr:GTP-binding protein [Oceanobacillus rekensis]
MTLEKQLINKTYYETIIENKENMHPIRILGEMYMNEQQNEVTDLSLIRFSQGEIYFLNKDFEAAIFKWENISNELEPWAQKNIADAHYELELLEIAEEYYKTVSTESVILKTEVLLQLFTLYIRRGKIELAADSITNAVDLNPDYSDVTEIARAFFEKQQDYANAVKLAVNEAVRTRSLSWFKVLETYVEHGHIAGITPNYFNEVLMTVYEIDQTCFESLAEALWNSYKQSDLYFPWLHEINNLILSIEQGYIHQWQNLSTLFKETYYELINGDYLIREISQLIPGHITNWMKISTNSDKLISSSAVLAWNDIFPSQIDISVVTEAERAVSDSPYYQNGMESGLGLFEAIQDWASHHDVLLSEKLEWMIRELMNLEHFHLLIAGDEVSGKADFVNSLLGEGLVEEGASPAILFKDAEEAEIIAISDKEVSSISNLEDVYGKRHQPFILYKKPLPYLRKSKLALIDTPVLSNQTRMKDTEFPYMRAADSVLFVLNADSPMTGKELDLAIRMNEQEPNMPIHFLLNNMERIDNSKEAIELVETTTSKINTYFSNANVFAFSKYFERESQLDELSKFIGSMRDGYNIEAHRTSKILYYVKESIKSLLEKRVEMEKSLIDNIEWNEEMVTKLNGAVNQLGDMEEEKTRIITQSYSKIKDEMKEDLRDKIPELLRNCSNMVNEKSNFEKIHVQLNEEMNKRVFNHIEEKVLPEFRVAIKDWITDSEEAFNECQVNLNELSGSFNYLYEEEKIALTCDFKVLDDWRRDAYRMTRGNIHPENINILLRSTPSQFLFKNAGKLFGALSQNKGMLQNKYKQFIEGKDYSETAETVTNKFIQQFEIFEQSLGRDINMFFTNPNEVLRQTLKETEKEIIVNKDALSNMRKKPEIYRDPLTQFDVKLRQFEWMTTSGKQVKV